MKFKSILFTGLILLGADAFALKVTLKNPPGDYRVYSLQGKDLKNKKYARDFKEISFDIPEKYIVKNSDGSQNLIDSLKNWRKKTKIADGNPRTKKNGMGYYPFKDSEGNNRYIALEHIYNNKPDVVKLDSEEPTISIQDPPASEEPTIDLSGATVSVTDNKLDPAELARRERLSREKIPIDVLKQSVRDQEKIRKQRRQAAAGAVKKKGYTKFRACKRNFNVPKYSTVDVSYRKSAYKNYNGPFKNEMNSLISMYASGTKSVSCKSRSQSGAKALVCNCANETSGKDPSLVEVNRTVLTRVVSSGYPGTITRVVWAQNKRRTSAAFSWTLNRWRVHSKVNNSARNGGMLKKCLLASMKAIYQGPNDRDNYHNYHISNPKWFRGNKKCQRLKRKPYISGNKHIFTKSRSKLKKKSSFERFIGLLGVSNGDGIN